MKNSNFIVYPVDEHGDAHSEHVLAHPFRLNHLFAPEQHPDTDSYTARLVSFFEPGAYYIEVSNAGGPYGNGEWELVIEQPGVPTSGAALPLTVEGVDTDVIGPIVVDGPVRVTVETFAPPQGSDGKPSTFNYFVWMTDEIGTDGERHINSLGPAPETLSAVWFPDADTTVGYFNVQSFGAWRATVEAA